MEKALKDRQEGVREQRQDIPDRGHSMNKIWDL